MKSLASDELYAAFGEYASDIARGRIENEMDENIAVVFDIGGFFIHNGITADIGEIAESLVKLKREKSLYFKTDDKLNGAGEFYVMIIIHNPNLMA